MKDHQSSHILVAAGLALTVGFLGACSSSTPDDKPGANASNTVKPAEDAILIFAQCMRDKGFDVPDAGLTADNLNNTSDTFGDTIDECQQEVGPALGEKNDFTKDPAAREQLIKGVECLCDLGYDVTDPEVDKGLNVKDIPSSALQKCFSSRGT